MPDEFVLYFVAAPEALTISLNEDLIKRVLERRLAAEPAPEGAGAESAELLGESVCAQACAEGIKLLAMLFQDEYRLQAQCNAWGNIPILNELRTRYPGCDPVALYERLWQIRLLCPGGGTYRWNDDWNTMESTVYGHPGAQRPGPNVPGALGTMGDVEAGLTFEDGGLRARVRLIRSEQADKQ